MSKSIYIASKVKHADRWKAIRAQGVNIISTWIDEAGSGETADFHDLWQRCINEAMHCDYLIIYREPDEVLKGAWVELGAALASDHLPKVFAIGLREFTISHYKPIRHFDRIEDAFAAVSLAQ